MTFPKAQFGFSGESKRRIFLVAQVMGNTLIDFSVSAGKSSYGLGYRAFFLRASAYAAFFFVQDATSNAKPKDDGRRRGEPGLKPRSRPGSIGKKGARGPGQGAAGRGLPSGMMTTKRRKAAKRHKLASGAAGSAKKNTRRQRKAANQMPRKEAAELTSPQCPVHG